MVLLTRSLCRFARPALTSSFHSAARPTHSSRLLASGASALRHNLGSIRTLTGKREKVKVLLVLYDGKNHAEEVSDQSAITSSLSKLAQLLMLYLQVPELLGTTENELGIRPWLEEQGHTLVTTSDKDGEDSKFDQELVDAEVIITTPYVVCSIEQYMLTPTVSTPDT
jgi:formate dehydrogenase